MERIEGNWISRKMKMGVGIENGDGNLQNSLLLME